MSNQQQIDEARKLLEKLWDEQGYCRSCGWHALLYEYHVMDGDIAEALGLSEDGILKLPCLSDDDGAYNHRGVRVDLSPVLGGKTK